MNALVAWTLAGVLATGVVCFVLLAFAPEIAALFRSRPPRENAPPGDRKQETNP